MERSIKHTLLAFELKFMRPTLLFALLIAIIVCFVDLQPLLDPLPQPGSSQADSPNFNLVESGKVDTEESNEFEADLASTSPFSVNESDPVEFDDGRTEPNVASIPTSIEPSTRQEVVT